MSVKYADIIIDISQSNVDKPFRYRIPDEMQDDIHVGTVVKVPFGRGNSYRTGYVIGLADEANFDIDKIKDISSVQQNAIAVESRLIMLAEWMKETYGCTMISALMTVMPVKERVRNRKPEIDINESIPEFSMIDSLEPQQLEIIEDYNNDRESDVFLLHGITGSGKTEVYIKMAEEAIERGQDVIVLVPEIALTYQTVARFSSYFQDSISILNSQLSKGEKYREFMKAKDGETHIMIGPRSALFAPFQNLGLIIIDEEHDASYKSEKTPKYHAREVAIERARLEGARVVLGSATPSIESYYKAQKGEYKLYTLKDRVKGSALPDVEVVDLREELRHGNRSIISRSLYTKLSEAFGRGEQAMLFINRRGFNSFVSCRSCGDVIKCPNCDVSLSLHGRSRLMCHYCGHTEELPELCPKCGSDMIGGYGIGTESLESQVRQIFPEIRTLRMDRDTTSRKGSHGEIIRRFRDGEADCLIGTQMIVKGHDFPRVTVVGNILADLSLFDGDFESSERTFDLLTQAAGRAGRDELGGNVIIQTYQPEHYAIAAAARQDYEFFYEYEIAYRRMLHFPPVYSLMGICISSESEVAAVSIADRVADSIRGVDGLDVVGPTEAYIYRINNIYRRVIYLKSSEYSVLTHSAELAQDTFDAETADINNIEMIFDFNPMRII